MGYSYNSKAISCVYSKKAQPKLGIGDIIWVIDGDESRKTNFVLADCFKSELPDHPPFAPEYREFKLKIPGISLMTSSPIDLSTSNAWFSELHNNFIIKQRFFEKLDGHNEITDGLLEITGISI